MRGIVLKPLDKCRVCGTKLQLVEEMKNVPLDGVKLTREPSIPEFCDSALYLCPECGLYQIPDIENYSDNYFFSNSKSVSSLYQDNLKTFESLISLTNEHQNILGIDGSGFDNITVKYFRKSIILDPERVCKEGGGQHNHFIFKKCSQSGFSLNDDFDVVYLLSTISHVDNPLQIMQDIATILKNGGVGWIEVVNGLSLIDRGLYPNFLPMVLNYYTPHSLSILLRMAGLETLMIQPASVSDYLNVFFRKPIKKPSLMEKRNSQINSILNGASKYKNIVVWGAGAKACYLFSCLSEKLYVTHVVDGNPEKQGLYMPGTQVPIEKPSNKIFENAELVIIFAGAFEEEIIKTLRDDFSYTGEVMTLSGKFTPPPPLDRFTEK